VHTRNRNRVITFCLCFMVCVMVILNLGTSIAIAQGIDVPNVRSNVYVYDDEHLLTDDQEQELNTLLRYLEEKTSIEFAVVTTSSFNDYSIEDYAHDLFNELGLGKRKKDNGILLLVSASEGHGRLEIGYGIDDILTDSKCGVILDDYYVVYRDKEEHGNSVYYTVKGVLSLLGQNYNIEFVENQEEIARNIEKDEHDEMVIEIIIIIILILIYIWFSMNSDGYGGGHYHSGGFRSSGGGGHFGGGRSGGGGASR